MKNKIVLEEHFATTDTIGGPQEYFPAQIWPERRRQLLDFQTERLERMDACGIGFAILSLNAPAIQGIPDSAKAIDVAHRANDTLAEQVAARPTRFGAFAALPMQDRRGYRTAPSGERPGLPRGLGQRIQPGGQPG
jgi:gamma-resorcylate decarboxylase